MKTTLVLDDLIQRLESVPARPFFPGGASVDFGVSPGFELGDGSQSLAAVAERRPEIGSTREFDVPYPADATVAEFRNGEAVFEFCKQRSDGGDLLGKVDQVISDLDELLIANERMEQFST